MTATAIQRPAVGGRVRRHGLSPDGWTALFVFLLGTGLCLARQPGVPSWNSIWQEDGAIFLSHAVNDPFLDTLGQVYNSYLHVLPRLLAGVVALFPLRFAAIGLSLAASMVIAGLGVYVYYASAAVFEHRWARALMGVMVVLLPAGGFEANANIANLHWYLVYAAFWVLVSNPRARGPVVLGSVICALATLSDPLAGLLLPLVARRLWESRRDPAARVVPIVFLLTLAVQVAAGYFQTPTGRYAASHVGDLPGIYALRVAGSAVVGDNLLGRLWTPYHYAFAYGALAIVVAMLVYGFLNSQSRRRLFLAESIFYSLVTLCVPLMLRGTENFLRHPSLNLNGSRYTVLPVLFLVGALICVFDGAPRRLSPAAWNRVRIGFAALLLGMVASSFNIFNVRTNGPGWKAQMAWAKYQCRYNPTELPQLYDNGLPAAPGQPATPADEIRIPVSPKVAGKDQPFAITVRCRDVH